MGYAFDVVNGIVEARKTAKVQEFDYLAFNAEQNYFLEKRERDLESMRAKATERLTLRRAIESKIQSLSDLWNGTDKRKKKTLKQIVEQILDLEEELSELL